MLENHLAGYHSVPISGRCRKKLNGYMRRKRVLAGALCVMFAAAFMVGCDSMFQSNGGVETSAVVQTPKEVTITVAGYPKETDTAGREICDAWARKTKEKYLYITVINDEYQYDVATFFPKAASGQLPNLCKSWYTEVNKIASAGYAADITDAMMKYGYDKAINSDLLKLVQKDGRYYALPETGYVMGLWYNVKLYRQAGLVDEKGIPLIPETYEELARNAQIIKEKTGKPGFFFPAKSNQGGWQFMNIAWAFGTEFEKQVNGKWTAVFNSPGGVAALQYLKDLKFMYGVLQDKVAVDTSEMLKMFGTDQVATAFGSIDGLNLPINDYGMSKDNQAMSALPAGPRGRVTLTGGDIIFVTSYSTLEQIDAVFKYLEIKGYTSKYSEEDVKAFEIRERERAQKNNIAGVYGLRIWSDPNRVAMENRVYEKYRNVNIDYWKDYMENASRNIRPEEPINCQELYRVLDGVIQEALTDRDSDPKALLDKAAAVFQKEYLNKVK